MKLFLILATLVSVSVATISTFDAVMTITGLGHASLKTASKNAIVATASQLLGADVSVVFTSSAISQANKNGVKGSSFTGIMTVTVSADTADFSQYANDCLLDVALTNKFQDLTAVNAAYQAQATTFKADELKSGLVASFTGFVPATPCPAPVPTTVTIPCYPAGAGTGGFGDNGSTGLNRRLDAATCDQCICPYFPGTFNYDLNWDCVCTPPSTVPAIVARGGTRMLETAPLAMSLRH